VRSPLRWLSRAFSVGVDQEAYARNLVAKRAEAVDRGLLAAKDERRPAVVAAVRSGASRAAVAEARHYRVEMVTKAAHRMLAFAAVWIAAPLMGILLDPAWPSMLAIAPTALALTLGSALLFVRLSRLLRNRDWAWPWTLLAVAVLLGALATYPASDPWRQVPVLAPMLGKPWLHTALVATAWTFAGFTVGFLSLVSVLRWSYYRLDRHLRRDLPEDRLICKLADLVGELANDGGSYGQHRQKEYRHKIDQYAADFEHEWPRAQVERGYSRLEALAVQVARDIATTVTRNQRDLILGTPSRADLHKELSVVVADIVTRNFTPAPDPYPDVSKKSRWRNVFKMTLSVGMAVFGLLLLLVALLQPWLVERLHAAPALAKVVTWSDQLRLGFSAIAAGLIVRADKLLLQFATKIVDDGNAKKS
jgi:hypothetical protein